MCLDVRDPYDVLGIARHASPEEIKAAFRKLAAQHHPDKNPGDAGAQQRFKDVNTAYQILSDPQKRGMFDRFGAPGVGRTPFTGGVPFDFSDFAANFPMDGFVGDLLERFGFKTGERGEIKKEISIMLEEAALGAEKELSYERVEVCSTCSGNGSTLGSSGALCSVCNGRGKIRFQQGLFPMAVERECSRCNGRGKIVTDPCAVCRGAGLVAKSRSIVVTLPAGVEDGATRLVERAGNVPRPDRGPGDLELTIRIRPHPFFKRVGDDVVCPVPVTFAQACLGGEVSVPTLDGKGKLRIPTGTQPGTVLRIKGKGMPKRVAGGRGDQLMEIKLEVPSHLTSRGRELVEKLAQELGEQVQPQQKTFVEKLKELFG